MADEFKEPMNTGAREWDAETYDAVSDPQFEWGMEVLERLELGGDEVAVDAGCGSGRVTAELADRLPSGRVFAVDGSAAMVEKAKERLGERAEYLVSDLVALELAEPVDLVFSTATFHWIPDHDALFRRLRAALKPGGRLVAQCGGHGNVAEHTRAIAAVAADPEYAQHLTQAKALWNFATPEETELRLAAAGFAEGRCWLQPKPVQPSRPLEFISTVTLGPVLDQLPEEKRQPFAEAVLAQEEEPLVLNYVRLNIEALAA
ncbi:MAG: trans-aconitate 2-methyltransferase [Solirubrobacterales bacterium]|jgi:trans-aconitate 2-methyltransferase|nr:trans-aconitate 2-methyltransferase [Solirubrobacterales bacterium]